ncbi:uncharacterized protein [Mycetomoellerius zeteki]|uniref:uncharacterized protein n=1 Tax=Mycetomoellerius zeteki TaxID=64791 RepID=UPI00084E7E30|nr:PREDICTED: uncharacterized protein LOC108729867 [Trachymyrmex zeteki]
MTIPRLELAGAVLVTKLVKHLLQVFNQYSISVYLWTDSTVAYTWIINHPSRWKDFVHNRVCYIQEALPQAQWGLVSGRENPADLATRGLTLMQLAEREFWWNGPAWLLEPPDCWSQKPTTFEKEEVIEERSRNILTTRVTSTENWDLLHRYSSLTRLVRITALCQRAINRFKGISNSSLLHPITTTELQVAKLFWVKHVQASAFSQELQLLSTEQPLPLSHPLNRLTPFRDHEGILRVGGRLQASSLDMEAKHPAILPRHSPLSQLIIADAHLRTLHGGTQITLCTIREQFWIIGGRVPVRSQYLNASSALVSDVREHNN